MTAFVLKPIRCCTGRLEIVSTLTESSVFTNWDSSITPSETCNLSLSCAVPQFVLRGSCCSAERASDGAEL